MMVRKLINEYGQLPYKLRFAIRTIVVGVVAYLAQDLSDGDIDDWESVYLAAKIALGTALVGYLTPVEPFVGPKFTKPDEVAVPSPPAVDSSST